MTSLPEIKLWKKYLAYIAKENKKIERQNDKLLREYTHKSAENRKLSAVWEIAYEQKRKERNDKISKSIADYKKLPFYKKLVTDEPNIYLSVPSSYNPYNQYYFPFFIPHSKPVYEDFLTMVAQGKLK